VAVDGQLQKLVIGGVAARRDPLDDRHQFGVGEHPYQAVAKRRAHHPRNIRTLQDGQQFLGGRNGFEKSAIALDPADNQEW
jgi:hypothetical protein